MIKTPDSSRQKKSVLRSLTGWWKKKRSYYVDIHQELQQCSTMFQEEESLGTSHAALQQDDSDDDIFDATSLHTPSPQLIIGKSPLSSSSISSSRSQEETPPKPTLMTPLRYSPAAVPPSTPNTRRSTASRPLQSPPTIPEEAPESLGLLQLPFVRTSFSTGSLLSMDSLENSYGGGWDDDKDNDEANIITGLNSSNKDHVVADFFDEHVTFLRVQTKPRQVEMVWAEENIF